MTGGGRGRDALAPDRRPSPRAPRARLHAHVVGARPGVVLRAPRVPRRLRAGARDRARALRPVPRRLRGPAREDPRARRLAPQLRRGRPLPRARRDPRRPCEGRPRPRARADLAQPQRPRRPARGRDRRACTSRSASTLPRRRSSRRSPTGSSTRARVTSTARPSSRRRSRARAGSSTTTCSRSTGPRTSDASSAPRSSTASSSESAVARRRRRRSRKRRAGAQGRPAARRDSAGAESRRVIPRGESPHRGRTTHGSGADRLKGKAVATATRAPLDLPAEGRGRAGPLCGIPLANNAVRGQPSRRAPALHQAARLQVVPRSDRGRLEPGVAVVVGPNGSGKSNVSDAIVWAAGSLTPSELRAEKPDDVLFGGSANRAAADHCEVELVFDNEDGGFGDELTSARSRSRAGSCAAGRVSTSSTARRCGAPISWSCWPTSAWAARCTRSSARERSTRCSHRSRPTAARWSRRRPASGSSSAAGTARS